MARDFNSGVYEVRILGRKVLKELARVNNPVATEMVLEGLDNLHTVKVPNPFEQSEKITPSTRYRGFGMKVKEPPAPYECPCGMVGCELGLTEP